MVRIAGLQRNTTVLKADSRMLNCATMNSQGLMSTVLTKKYNGRVFFICEVHKRFKKKNCQEYKVLKIAQRS